MRDFITLVLGLVVAVAAAAVMWGWWRSPVPTFMVFGAVLHGMMLGAGLMWLLDRVQLRSRVRRAAVGAAAGAVSVIVLTFAQYAGDAHDYRRHTQRAMAAMLQAPDPGTSALDHYDRNVLEPVTGRRGIIGYLQFRDTRGRRRAVRAAEAFLVVGIAATLCAHIPARATPPPPR